MKKILTLLVLASVVFCSCHDDNCDNSIFVTTIVYDTIPSPLVAGGSVSGNTGSITERGILYGLNDSLFINNSTLVGGIQYGSSYGGFDTPSNLNGKITSGLGGGYFSSDIQHLLNGTNYYVKAYAINSSGVFYGQPMLVPARSYTREVNRFDIANVFWTNSYTLFDELNDEIIEPINGNYHIWYASNEQPYVHETTMTIFELPSLLFYKFKSLENCQRWCDIKNGIIH
jgi:hypothetical protein